MTTQTNSYDTVWNTIRQWPQSYQLKLMQDIIQELASENDETSPLPKQTADKALGLLQKHDDQPAPSDQEVKLWLEEERLKRHGFS